MTLLVIVEQHMKQLANGEVWTYDMINSSFWERYLNVFENVIVCGRIKQCSDNDTMGLAKSSHPNVVFVAMPDFRGVTGLIKNYVAIRKAIKKAIKMADCIIYRAPSPISMVAYPLVHRSKKPFALEFMLNPITMYSKSSSKSILQPLIQSIVTRQAYDMCQKANGVSYVTERVLQELFPCRAMIDTNNSNYFTTYYSTICLKKEDYTFMDMPKEVPKEITIVHSGKMYDYRKGQDILIRAISLLHNKNYNVKLTLLGNGTKRLEFENLAKHLGVDKYVLFEGWKTGYNSVQKVLQSGHIFAFPSYGEGLPRSVIEPMANSILTIGSAVDGILELLPNQLLVKDMTPEAYANKIADIIDNWSEYMELRLEIYERSLQYENSILSENRNMFYKRLKALCEKKY